MTDLHAAWLAGLLEGEGSFMRGPPSKPNQPVIALSMTDEDVVARAALLMGVGHQRHGSRSARWKPSYSCTLRGKPAVVLMKRVEPFMGQRRRAQILEAVSSYKNLRKLKLSPTKAKAIRRRLKTETISAIARRYKVNRDVIRRIRDGQLWKHVV